jgi:hypothetical protein
MDSSGFTGSRIVEHLQSTSLSLVLRELYVCPFRKQCSVTTERFTKWFCFSFSACLITKHEATMRRCKHLNPVFWTCGHAQRWLFPHCSAEPGILSNLLKTVVCFLTGGNSGAGTAYVSWGARKPCTSPDDDNVLDFPQKKSLEIVSRHHGSVTMFSRFTCFVSRIQTAPPTIFFVMARVKNGHCQSDACVYGLGGEITEFQIRKWYSPFLSLSSPDTFREVWVHGYTG